MDSQDPKLPAETDDFQELRLRRDSPSPGSRDAFKELTQRLCTEIAVQMGGEIDVGDKSQLRAFVHDRLDVLLRELGIAVNRHEKRLLLDAIVTELSQTTPKHDDSAHHADAN